MTAANRLNLKKIVSQLSTHYGPPRPALTTDPFALILLENIAYLVSDSRREEAFKLLRKDVGTKPHEILTAANKDLLPAARLGGMQPERRVSRLREIALIAMNEFAGNLDEVLKLPLAKAKQALRRFPGIGEPARKRFSYLLEPIQC